MDHSFADERYAALLGATGEIHCVLYGAAPGNSHHETFRALPSLRSLVHSALVPPGSRWRFRVQAVGPARVGEISSDGVDRSEMRLEIVKSEIV